MRLVLIVPVIFDDGDHRISVDKAYCVIDMSVCIITYDAFLYPQYLVHPIIVHEKGLYLFTLQMRIAVLVQQTTGGSDQRSFAIEIHGASFHDDAGIKDGQVKRLAYERGDHIIQIEWWIFITPCII